MDVFLEVLSCGCCVDIQQCAMYNIVSYTARFYEKDIIVAVMSFYCL